MPKIVITLSTVGQKRLAALDVLSSMNTVSLLLHLNKLNVQTVAKSTAPLTNGAKSVKRSVAHLN